MDRRELEIQVELKRRGAEKKSPLLDSSVDRGLQGFNVGLAKGAGLPVDLANFALSFIGLGSEKPVGGSKFFQETLSDVGAAPKPGKERETLGKVGRITEEIGAATVPFGALGTAVRSGKTGGKILKPVFDFFRKSPKQAAVAEIASATGAGVGATIAQTAYPDNPIAEMTGQLLGGLVSSPTIIAESSPAAIANIRRAVRVLVTKEGSIDTAAQIVQKSARDRAGVINTLSQPPKAIPGSKLTVGQETGDAGMLSLERSAMKKSEDLKDGVAEALTKTNVAVDRELTNLAGSGDAQILKTTLQDRVDYLKNLLGVRTQQSMSKATDDLSKLSPDVPREQANIIIRREIDGAYDAGRAQETDLWNAVPKKTPASVETSRSEFADILSKRDRRVDDVKDVPNWLRELFRGKRAIKGEQSLGRVQNIRSRVLNEMRLERGAEVPNRKKVRIYARMADALLEDMSVAASDEVALARAFSRDLNERFTQGTVGDILGFSKTGEPSLTAAATLEGSVGRAGPRGGVAVDDINRAVGVQTSPQDTAFQDAQQAIRSFIADKFMRKFPDGKVNTTSGRRFLNENKEALARNPEIEAEIKQAIKSQDDAARFIESQKGVELRLNDKNRTAAAVFLDADVDDEVRRVFSSRNPAANMKSLVKSAVKDKTGEAMMGLRSSVMGNIRAAGSKKIASDLNQDVLLNGRDMKLYVKSNQKAIEQVFSKDQLSRLNMTIETATKAQSRLAAGFPGQQLLEESPDAFTDMVLSAVGANIGGGSALGQATGAPLVMAGRTAAAARAFGRKWVSKIPAGRITDILDKAVLDRNLMLELQKRPKTIKEAEQQIRALRGFLINLVPEAFREPIELPITIDITKDSSDFEDK